MSIDKEVPSEPEGKEIEKTDVGDLAVDFDKQKLSRATPDLSKAGSTDAELLEHVLAKGADEIIPWEPCKLPSAGLYYDEKIPGGEVQVRAMGLDTDKILATQRLVQSGHAIDFLFKKCIKLPNNFDPLDLVAGDRTFLLYYLRGITHGNIYEYAIKCTDEDCKRMSTHVYDLNLLAGKITRPTAETMREPFKVKIPYMTKATKRDFWVSIKLPRGRDTQAILKKQKMDKQIQAEIGSDPARDYSEHSIDQTIEQNLNLIIVDVMGDSDRIKVEKFISRMHGSDTATVREYLRNKVPGVDTIIEIECPHCGQEMRMDLPVTESFFRPTDGGRARE